MKSHILTYFRNLFINVRFTNRDRAGIMYRNMYILLYFNFFIIIIA